MIHDRETIAEFLNGETRIIFARQLDGKIIEMPQGHAEAFKDRCRANELTCPVPGCPNPALTAYARAPHKRDGFAHRAGRKHKPESAFHIQGKARIAAWVREHYPQMTVVMEQASNTQRERVADVMVTDPTGARIAIEIQYAALTVDEWRERSESYRRQGIVDVWLLGHTGSQMRGVTRTVNDVTSARLTALQRTMREEGRHVLWFNPITAEIATATTTQTVPGFSVPTATTEAQHFTCLADVDGRLEVMPLDDFELTPTGITSQRLRWLGSQLVAWEAATVAHEEWVATYMNEKEQLLRRQRAERDPRDPAAVRRMQLALNAARVSSARVHAWTITPAIKSASEVFERRDPPWVTHPDLPGIPVPQRTWRSWVFLRYLHHHEPHEVIELAHVAAAMRSHFDLPSDAVLNPNIREFFRVLADNGIVDAGANDANPLCRWCGKPMEKQYANVGGATFHIECRPEARSARRRRR